MQQISIDLQYIYTKTVRETISLFIAVNSQCYDFRYDLWYASSKDFCLILVEWTERLLMKR